ncbi:MAG: type I phosphomannose isomerase catalytic subunit [Bacteroidota bacterium]
MTNQNGLYPLVFHPHYKEKLWGGQKIRTVLQKDFGDLRNCGETWEISGVDGNISVVAEGPLAGQALTDLIDTYKGKLLGEKVFAKFGTRFPLLVKFIDANDDLSIQVHPHDEMAKARHDSFGKTEMWYIMQADEGASLISGFNQEMDKEKYQEYFDSGRLTEILNREEAEANDVFFLPAGRVHTIGKGLLLAEIQQTSDITYRIYDFDRVGVDGKKRELHVEQALDAIDYKQYGEYKTSYTAEKDQSTNLVSCRYFVTNRLDLEEPMNRDYSAIDSFVIYVAVGGKATLNVGDASYHLEMGQAMLVPAAVDQVEIVPEGQINLLEAWVPIDE